MYKNFCECVFVSAVFPETLSSRAVAGAQSGTSLSGSMREDVLWQAALYGIKVFLVIL